MNTIEHNVCHYPRQFHDRVNDVPDCDVDNILIFGFIRGIRKLRIRQKVNE